MAMAGRCGGGFAAIAQMNNIINVIESQLGRTKIPNSGVALAPARISNEVTFWGDGERLETDSGSRPRLKKYWDNINYASWTPTDTAWSAAFISYILRGTGFPGASAHFAYTQAIADGAAPGWGAFSIPKNQGQFKLSPGDVLVRPRGSGAPKDEEYWYSHGDVVWQVGTDALLVGGNLSESAKVAKRIPVDSEGYPRGNIQGYQIILKKKKATPLKDTKTKWIALAALVGLVVWVRR